MSPLGGGMVPNHPQGALGGRSSGPQPSPQQPGSNAASSQRLTHFDPIASMNEHVSNDNSNPGSQQQSVVPPTGPTQSHQSMMTTTMNMTSMQVSPAAPPATGSMVNFHTSMQSMQGIHQPNMGSAAVPTSPQQQQQQQQQQQASQQQPQQQQYGMGPQTVNNTYVNATMSIQQMNIQNVIGSTYNPNMPGTGMNPGTGMMHPHHHPHSPHHHSPMGGSSGAHTISSASTPGHPIMHSSVSPKSGSRATSNMPPTGNMGNVFPGHPMGAQRMPQMAGPNAGPGLMPRAPGAPGYNATNIQVKASAPNTIQYLPARPQNSAVMGARQPSLDFLRYASPLTNLDSKVPTHNLQYFPKNGASPQQPPGQMSSMPGMMPATQRSMMDPMRGPAPGMMGPQQPGQVYPGTMPPAGDPSMYCRPARPGTSSPLMNIGTMGAGPPPTGPISGMMANRQMPLSPSDIPPDTSQPLPSSMGHSFNYKQSAAFYGPTTADPNYAAQFHNFQQQLYATNTRGSQQNNMTSASPGFFGAK